MVTIRSQCMIKGKPWQPSRLPTSNVPNRQRGKPLLTMVCNWSACNIQGIYCSGLSTCQKQIYLEIHTVMGVPQTHKPQVDQLIQGYPRFFVGVYRFRIPSTSVARLPYETTPVALKTCIHILRPGHQMKIPLEESVSLFGRIASHW